MPPGELSAELVLQRKSTAIMLILLHYLMLQRRAGEPGAGHPETGAVAVLRKYLHKQGQKKEKKDPVSPLLPESSSPALQKTIPVSFQNISKLKRRWNVGCSCFWERKQVRAAFSSIPRAKEPLQSVQASLSFRDPPQHLPVCILPTETLGDYQGLFLAHRF